MKTESPLDFKKPEVKPGEVLCAGCWAVTTDKRGWAFFNFKYLSPVNLCPKCTKEQGEDIMAKQNAGL